MIQVTKVWWDGKKLMAEPIDPTTIYQEPAPTLEDWGPGPHEYHSLPAQQEPAGMRDAIVATLVREGINKHRARELADHFVGLRAAQPVLLEDIEQYRMQMAGICTAAIGYWKEGDGIHPDYNTLALRDVAKLYAKYDELYKAQPVPHAVIAGALFDFMGWLTSRKERLVLSSADEAGPAVDAIKDFAKMRGLSLDDARVQDWQDNIKGNT